MQRILFFLVCLLLPFAIFAQIGVNTTNPDTSSILDISSTNKGLLIPRMSTGDRQAISKPRNSLLVYDTTNAKYMYFLGNQWYELNPITAPFTHDSVTISKKLSVGDPSKPTGQKLTVNGSAVVKEGFVAKQVTSPTIITQDVSTTNITATGKITVNEILLPNTGMGLVPAGIIVMWSGTVAQIPVGWALCDGESVLSNGQKAPDLRGRFIVGSGQNTNLATRETTNPNYSIGDKGGVNSYSLLKSELPAVKPSGSAQIEDGNFLGEGGSDYGGSGNPQGIQLKIRVNSEQYIPVALHMDNLGDGIAHENRPPFYVLAYIVKL